MEMKEILALICTIGVVFLLIFIVSAVRGGNAEDPDAPVLEPTGMEYEQPAETDIWDVLHEMQATTAPAYHFFCFSLSSFTLSTPLS